MPAWYPAVTGPAASGCLSRSWFAENRIQRHGVQMLVIRATVNRVKQDGRLRGKRKPARDRLGRRRLMNRHVDIPEPPRVVGSACRHQPHAEFTDKDWHIPLLLSGTGDKAVLAAGRRLLTPFRPYRRNAFGATCLGGGVNGLTGLRNESACEERRRQRWPSQRTIASVRRWHA